MNTTAAAGAAAASASSTAAAPGPERGGRGCFRRTVTGVAPAGTKGTAYVKNTATNDVTIYHGFTYTDTDYIASSWTVNSSAANQLCDPNMPATATPTIQTTGSLTLAGTFSCSPSFPSFSAIAGTTLAVQNNASISMNSGIILSAGSAFVMGSNVAVADAARNTDMEFNIPAGDNQTWTNVSVNGAQEGDFTIDDPIDLTLAGASAINANAKFLHLTNLTVPSGTSISADGKGCQEIGSSTGFGPDAFNECATANPGGGTGTTSAVGSGGGGHGGAGGSGFDTVSRAGGSTVADSATAPDRFGASAGHAGTLSGAGGGGALRLVVAGVLTHGGAIGAVGSPGSTTSTNQASGGGAGGSIYVTTFTYNCTTTGTFSAAGGAGGNVTGAKGGGGGGGRVSLEYTSDTSTGCPISGLTAAGVAPGGTATAAATAGGTGSLNTAQVTNPSPVITSISPNTKQAGSAQFTLTVNGTNFVSASVVNFNGNARTTTYVSGTQLTATILAADIASPGTYPVTVFNPRRAAACRTA